MVSKSYMELPGPGLYGDSDQHGFGKSGMAISIRGKRKDDRRDMIPGPGAYDKNYTMVKTKEHAVKIGSSKRSEFISRSVMEMPGPGNYEHHQSSIGKHS